MVRARPALARLAAGSDRVVNGHLIIGGASPVSHIEFMCVGSAADHSTDPTQEIIMSMTSDRRSFLKSGAAAAVAIPALQGFSALTAGASEGRPPRHASQTSGGYGPLKRMKPTVVQTQYPNAGNIEWIALPEGFQYAVVSVAGDEMADGNPVPTAHDGMGAFALGNGRVRLVRNHEIRDGDPAPTISPTEAYDSRAGAGCTTVELSFTGGIPKLETHFVSLNGTAVNCAGGATPWGSWISSEETTETRAETHGWNFEVPAAHNGVVVPVPLLDMGRFAHEAVCVDPATGIVYETEDRGDSGFYRFIPNSPGELAAGGELQMLKVRGVDNADLSTGQHSGRAIRVEWVAIDDPQTLSGVGVKDQGLTKGAATFRRLEGCWFGNGAVYFNSTDGGEAGQGQIWEYKPAGRSGGFLQLVFESPGGEVLSAPDNITVSPRGGILLCEDHGFDRPADPFAPLPNVADPADDDAVEVQYMKGLTKDGRIFDFAANLLDDKEWAGACFSPDGDYLFANTQGTTRDFSASRAQDHGRTYVIWGPWEHGAL